MTQILKIQKIRNPSIKLELAKELTWNKNKSKNFSRTQVLIVQTLQFLDLKVRNGNLDLRQEKLLSIEMQRPFQELVITKFHQNWLKVLNMVSESNLRRDHYQLVQAKILDLGNTTSKMLII